MARRGSCGRSSAGPSSTSPVRTSATGGPSTWSRSAAPRPGSSPPTRMWSSSPMPSASCSTVARTPASAPIAPRLVLPDGSTQHSVYGFPTLPYLAAFNAGLYRVVPRPRRPAPAGGPLEPGPPARGAVGDRRVSRLAAGGVRRRGRIRSGAVDVRRGPGSRLAAPRGGLANGVRARRARAPRRGRGGEAGVRRAAARPLDGCHLRLDRTPARTSTPDRRRGLNVAGALARRDRDWARVHRRGLQRRA